MANEKRLIDANALIEQIRLMANRTSLGEISPSSISGSEVCHLILTAPTVDAVEVVHARWEYIPIIDSLGRYRCERCFHYVDAGTDRNYCPNCGAKMDGDGNG